MTTTAPAAGLLVRPVTAADVPAVTAVYTEAVLNGTATFELTPPDETEMAARIAHVGELGFPWLVAEEAGRILGYAYFNWYRTRPAYRFLVEDSIYVDPAAHGRGVGRALLAALLERAHALGLRQMIAVIGDGANAASIGLHAALGFHHIGRIEASGWKHGRWLDTVLMQIALGDGGATPPVDRTP